jgi:hypothetical protein
VGAGEQRHRGWGVAWVVLVALISVVAQTATPAVGAVPLHIDLSGVNGAGRILHDGLPCQPGSPQAGQGNYRDYEFESDAGTGVLSSLDTMMRGAINVHDLAPLGTKPTHGFLLGDESRVSLTNQRGEVLFRLRAGTGCDPAVPGNDPNALTFNGDTVSGNGTFAIDPQSTNGAFRGATLAGPGTFSLSAGLAPGATNAWHIVLNGQIQVLQPSLQASFVRAWWGNLGVDYVLRIVTVEYKLTNTGPGDTFGAALTGVSSPTAGVTALGPVPQPLDDLHSGESQDVVVRFQLGLSSPCQLIILNCNFVAALTTTMPDALDQPTMQSSSVASTAPLLPPPA